MANVQDAVLVTEAEPIDLASGGPRILYVNAAFTTMTGYTSADAVGDTPRMLQSPWTDRRELDRLRRALAAWEPVEVELLNVRKDHSEFWVQFIVVPVMNDAGWYTHWVSVQRDVTDQRRRIDHLKAMVHGTTEVVVLIDLDGVIRAASSAAQKTLAGDGSLISQSVTDFTVPEHERSVREALQRLSVPDAADSAGEMLLNTVTGWQWFAVTARQTKVPGTAATVVISAVDVTRGREERAALRQARRRFHGAFTDAPIGMAVHGSDGALLEVNAQLSRLLGRSEEALLHLSLDDLVHPDDRRESREERRQVIAGRVPVGRHETRLLHADGRTVGVMLSSSIVRPDADSVELVVHIEDISARKALETRLTHQAMHDGLTRLPNRTLFLDRLEVALNRSERVGTSVSVLFIDLDQFKAINDSQGHEVGDEVLAATAKRLTATIRPGDTAARFGGDEFTILCDETGPAEALGVAERIAKVFRAPISSHNQADIHLRVSIGIATSAKKGLTADELLRDADMAMYAAKGTEASVVVYDAHLRTETIAFNDRGEELTRGLSRDELELSFQPFATLTTGGDKRPREFEALVRWRHPQRGLLSPGAFIPFAEESGLITAVDRWVLRHALEAVAMLAHGSARVWVNLSLRSLSEVDLVEYVQRCLQDTGMPATSLGLELTERAVGEGGAHMGAIIHSLRGLGIELAVDDFGTGYSSLSSLIDRPVDVLKIDRSFVNGLPGAQSTAVVSAIIAMAAAFELDTVAEGVEEEQQLTVLEELGCNRVQGYLLARPMDLAGLIAFYSDTDTSA